LKVSLTIAGEMIVPDCDAGAGDVAEIFFQIKKAANLFQISRAPFFGQKNRITAPWIRRQLFNHLCAHWIQVDIA